eukprot:2012648-Ditylum_brightwellii.AAC.1
MAGTIFQPFTWAAWGMIIFIVLPVLSLLMLVHEYDAPGNSYKNTRSVLVVGNRPGQQPIVAKKRVPMTNHVLQS